LLALGDGIRDKARGFYGYGRWEAPYWFIGPEEGGDDAPETRVAAWRQPGEPQLCDCIEFHKRIKITKWHREAPRAPLERTWRPLMLLLMTFLDRDAGLESLRRYQRAHWGVLNGETCVIELSGLPAADGRKAKELMLKLFNQVQFDNILQERRDFIRGKLRGGRPPELVVMYGWGERHRFKEIAANCTLRDETFRGFPAEIGRVDATRIAIAQHPNRKGLVNAYWVDLGQRLRQL